MVYNLVVSAYNILYITHWLRVKFKSVVSVLDNLPFLYMSHRMRTENQTNGEMHIESAHLFYFDSNMTILNI